MTSRTHLLAKSSNCFTLNLHEAEFTLCLNYLVAHVRFAVSERDSDDVRSHIYLVVIHTSEVGYKLQIAHFGRQGESGRQIYQRSCVVRQIYSVFIRRANHVYLLSCLFAGPPCRTLRARAICGQQIHLSPCLSNGEFEMKTTKVSIQFERAVRCYVLFLFGAIAYRPHVDIYGDGVAPVHR